MALSVDEAREMYDAVQQAGVKHIIGFNYRRVPAIQLAKRIIDEGKLGDIYHSAPRLVFPPPRRALGEDYERFRRANASRPSITP